MTTPLTTHLQTLHTPLYKTATTHPFLTHAASGTLPKPLLAAWLSQDRLYAQSYIRFIGALLSKIRLPSHNPDSAKPGAGMAEHRAVDVLVDALVNIRRELLFFGDVAREYGVDLEALPVRSSCRGGEEGEVGESEGEDVEEEGGKVFGPNPITHAYIDLFMSASSPGTTLLEGMVVLWATEITYLRAWQYASSHTSPPSSSAQDPTQDSDGGALRTKFIPNWTSPEFEEFVCRIGDVVDEMAGQVKGSEAREWLLGRCAVWWRQVLWLEGRFWPDVRHLS